MPTQGRVVTIIPIIKFAQPRRFLCPVSLSRASLQLIKNSTQFERVKKKKKKIRAGLSTRRADQTRQGYLENCNPIAAYSVFPFNRAENRAFR
jgi:hypothetical protein